MGGDRENPSVLRRLDPNFPIVGIGEKMTNVRSPMHLFRSPEGVYTLLNPKGGKRFEQMYGSPPVTLQNATNRPVVCTDNQGIVTVWNTCMARITGISKGNAEGQSIADLIHPAHREAARGFVNGARATIEQGNDDSIRYVFPINHNNDDANPDRTLGPLRVPLTIKIRRQDDADDPTSDAIGLVMIGGERNAYGDLLPFVEPGNTAGEPVTIRPVCYLYHGTGTTIKKIHLKRIERQSQAEFAEAKRRWREEFGLPPTTNNSSIYSAEELEEGCVPQGTTEAQVKERLIRCGAISRYQITGGQNSDIMKSHQKFTKSGTTKVKSRVAEIKRTIVKLSAKLAEQGVAINEPYDPDSDELHHLMNHSKVENNNICGPSFTTATNGGWKTSATHITPRDPRNGEFFSASPKFIQAKFEGEEGIATMHNRHEWAYYQSIKGRPCILPPREFPHNFKPRFMNPEEHENSTAYIHTGSGLEAGHFGLHHKDTSCPRTNFTKDPRNEESQRQFLLQVDRCNASFTHDDPEVREIRQSGSNSNGDIIAGCERLGTTVNALPVKTMCELKTNHYYGFEFMTVTK